jgi:twitching motility protein PilI
MGKRESLKDMQTRLAERLSLARGSNGGQAWLAVSAGRGSYLLSLRQSGEILPAVRLHSVPRTAAWFMGVINNRGSLFGAVNLGQFIDQTLRAAAGTALPLAHHAYEDEQSRFVTLNAVLEVNCALHVSRLDGLRSAENFESSVPSLHDAPAYFGRQFLDAQGKVWQELDLQTLAQTPQFINISASSGIPHGHSQLVS